MLRKILQPFYTAYVVVTFLISLFIAFPFFLLISIGNNSAARSSIWAILKWWSKGWLWLIGMPVRVSGPKPTRGRYIIVSNHISYLDTLVIFSAVDDYFRALGKKEISRVPLVGFIYKQIVLMVDRSSGKSRALSMRLMWRALKYESSVLIFPEGTFNETEAPLKDFYDGAFRLAINAQVTIVPLIFPDTVNRWHYSAWWKLWPGRNRAIYLPEVSVSGMQIHDVPVLKQQVHEVMEKALIAANEQ
ncbi:MAG: 1-acyl-sn-glycerol-3-phosphate acyltransferase [Taibaiella sp.]|nr:1-acyl-sn-glycerol-3-phosphate acyltransferase [Taibaiella sp.]